jgi:hypothetical protein
MPAEPHHFKEITIKTKESSLLLMTGINVNFTHALLKLRREHPALANSSDFLILYGKT